jgi:hypothetical protein
VKTITDIHSATDAQLLAFYNDHNPQRTFDRFPNNDRNKFEEWCIELLAELAEEEVSGEGADSKSVKIDHRAMAFQAIVTAAANGTSLGKMSASDIGEPLKSTGSGPVGSPPLAKAPYGPTTKENIEAATFEVKPRTSNAAGISASWLNPEVAAARLTRNGTSVTVEGVTTEHKSVAEAFRAFSLPVAKHIRFRMKLKASLAEIFEHEGKQYHFKII